MFVSVFISASLIMDAAGRSYDSTECRTILCIHRPSSAQCDSASAAKQNGDVTNAGMIVVSRVHW